MQILVNAQHLAQELRQLSKIVATKPVIPILSHTLIRAENHRIWLSATDLEMGLTTPCQGEVLHPGVCAIPASRLLALAEQCAKTDMLIVTDDLRVAVTAGSFKSKLAVLPADDFPALPAPPEQTGLLFDAKIFQQLITRVDYAIAEKESRQLLRGALLSTVDHTSTLVTTDGKRLALTAFTRSEGLAEPLSLVIPAKCLEIIADQSSTGEVEILVGPRHLFFRFGDRLYTSRVLDGEFPKYERVIPRSNEILLVLERAAFIDVLKRVQLTSNEMNAVMFTTSINGNGMALNVSAQSAEIGSAEESLPVVYDGAQVTFQMSSTFILDFLQVASEPQITIAMKDAKSPFLFIDGHVTDAKDQTHFGVIVPMG